MVNTVPVAESIPVQSSWQVGGWWVVGVGGGVATRGVRLLIGKEVLLLLEPLFMILWKYFGGRESLPLIVN